jgi:hypothetical protein
MLMIIAAGTITAATPLRAQSPEQATRASGPVSGRWDIVDRQGRALDDRTLDSLIGTTLYVSDGRLIDSMEIASIARLERAPGVSWWTGVACGAVFGAVVGGAIGYASYSDPPPKTGFNIDLGPQYDLIGGAAVGLLVGVVAGGTVSALSSSGLALDLSHDDAATTVRRVRQLFRSTPYNPP